MWCAASLLGIASAHGHTGLVKSLLGRRAAVDATFPMMDASGRQIPRNTATPLLLAGLYDRASAAQLLLRAGASLAGAQDSARVFNGVRKQLACGNLQNLWQHNPSGQGPMVEALRFRVGDIVKCRVGQGWTAGVVVRLGWNQYNDSECKDVLCPYQVLSGLSTFEWQAAGCAGELLCPPNDHDGCIQRLPQGARCSF